MLPIKIIMRNSGKLVTMTSPCCRTTYCKECLECILLFTECMAATGTAN